MKSYTKIIVAILIILSIFSLSVYLIVSSKNIPEPETTAPPYIDVVTYDIAGRSLYLEKLDDLSKQYEGVKPIIENIDFFPEEILDLVLSNPETIDFALDYPNEYPARESNKIIDIQNDYDKGKIPFFPQWDKRWGYYDYGNSPIALNGCGPTALSMVIVGLTGDLTQNPKEIADFSYNNGYYVEGTGTSWTLMSEGAKNFGISPKELSLSENVILSSLQNGNPIIASMRKGHFTTTSHYIVLTGATENGKITILDPNSIKRSNMEWDMNIFIKEIRNLWEFSFDK